MFPNWAEYINDFKTLVLADRRQLGQRRLAVQEEELEAAWQECTLRQMQSIFTIHNDYAVNFLVSQLLQPYLSSRKIIYEAYIVSRCDDNYNEESLMYIYDCRLFRNGLYSKEENQFISSFLLLYKENVEISGPVFEVVDCRGLPPCRWILKVKESAILRVYAYVKEVMKRVSQRNDKIVLPEEKYTDYMQEWMNCYYNSYNIETTTSYFFRGVLALLQNQLLTHYTCTLTPQQTYQHMFHRPIKTIEKPKNVQQFTFTEGILETQTKWQTLKITAYRLKYRVEETPQQYQCFRVDEPEQDLNQEGPVEEEDRQILQAFSVLRQAQEEYQTLYY